MRTSAVALKAALQSRVVFVILKGTSSKGRARGLLAPFFLRHTFSTGRKIL